MEVFTDLFRNATKNIPKEYFQLPVAGQEDQIYRERVYCYELYHQLRLQWPEGAKYSLCGEIDKRGHSLIRGNALDNKKPDFLVHVPGVMEKNYLVMEVKPVNAQRVGIKKDLKTLTAFCERGYYSRAILLIYGSSNSALEKIIAASKSFAEIDDNQKIRLDLIELWHHPAPDTPARHNEW